jgi:Flp pilus assembly protein TadG
MRRRISRSTRCGTRRGTAAVELAVCLPLLVTLVMGAWEVGRLVEVKQLLCNAVREGGRQAATGRQTTAEVQQYVVNYLTMNGLTGVTTEMVTFTDLTNTAVQDPTAATQMDRLRVSVTVPYTTFRWSLLSQITSDTSLSASADWFSMRDSPISVNLSIPTN